MNIFSYSVYTISGLLNAQCMQVSIGLYFNLAGAAFTTSITFLDYELYLQLLAYSLSVIRNI